MSLSKQHEETYDRDFIPYIVEPHPDTGVTNAKLGIWVFLASEVMLFGALFSSYILLRVGAGTTGWPSDAICATFGASPGCAPVDIYDVKLAMINTLVLISSSVTVVMAWASLKLGNLRAFKIMLWITIACGLAFMVIKGIEYNGKFSHGVFPSTHNMFAVYFLLTGLHGLHVVGGVVAMIWFATGGAKMWETNPGMLTSRVEATGLYWHFVDLVWIFLFPSIYLL